jgi:exonuclease VII small subunit
LNTKKQQCEVSLIEKLSISHAKKEIAFKDKLKSNTHDFNNQLKEKNKIISSKDSEILELKKRINIQHEEALALEGKQHLHETRKQVADLFYIRDKEYTELHKRFIQKEKELQEYRVKVISLEHTVQALNKAMEQEVNLRLNLKKPKPNK